MELEAYAYAVDMQDQTVFTVEGNGRERANAYIKGSGIDVGTDIFCRGVCLPSDNKMTEEQQDRIIEIIHS